MLFFSVAFVFKFSVTIFKTSCLTLVVNHRDYFRLKFVLL